MSKKFIDGDTVVFHHFGGSLGLSEEDRTKVRYFCNTSIEAEMIIGERRFIRVHRRGIVTVEWCKIGKPLISYAVMWDQYTPIYKEPPAC